MKVNTKLLLGWTGIFLIAGMVFAGIALGRENEEWEKNTPEINAWYSTLMQPDNPMVSCCGEADAYWADDFEQVCEEKNGKKECLYVAYITDPRSIVGRNNRPIGTRIVIPNHKIKSNNDAGAKGNPTGHGIVFIAPGWVTNMDDGRGSVYCYLPPSGL